MEQNVCCKVRYVLTHLIKKNVSTENVALLIVWNMKFLSVTVLSVLFSATDLHE
jgi:hypothetical protein